MNKNNEFKEINNINYNMQFFFARFFKKQIKKIKLYTVKIFGINIIY